MTVRELLARMDSRELSEWLVFYAMEPWGTEVEDWRSALISSTIANVNRDPKKRRKPYKPEDFMPPRLGVQEHKKEQSWQEQKRNLDLFMRAWIEKF